MNAKGGMVVAIDGLAALLAHEVDATAGLVLALAWQAGLTRQEIQSLQWEQVSFDRWQLCLPKRTVSLCADLASRLGGCACQRGHVVCGRQGALRPESISRMARTALSKGGLPDVGLHDLRHDYIQTQLERRSWAEVSQELAMTESDLRKAYGKTLLSPPPKHPVMVAKEGDIQALLSRPSLGALAVGLAYYHGLSSQQLRGLRWETLPSLPQVNLSTLRPKSCEGLVFPFSGVTLAQLARKVLSAQGLVGVTLRSLALQAQRREPLEQVEVYLQRHHSLTCQEGQGLLSLSKNATYRLLQAGVNEGQLVQVGGYYYSATQVPPLEDHVPLVLSLLQRRGVVYVEDVHTLLHLRESQCQGLLQSMVSQGHLVRFGTRYQRSPQSR